MRSFISFFLLAFSLVLGLNASTITYTTPAGSNDTDGDPVNATALFTTGNGSLTITLSNLQTNIKAAGQLLTDLEFTLSVSGTNALSSSSATTIFVNSGGTTSPGSTGSTGWGFGTNGSNLILCIICGNSTLSTSPTGTPSDGIIGPGPYTNANASIAGNAPHNPFINQTATFVISNALINSDTTVNSAIFSFGTTFGDDIRGVPGTPRTTETPEPISMSLLGVGLLGLGVVGRVRWHRASVN